MKLVNFNGFLAAMAYSAGAIVCHQLPERSFALSGRQLPVCARCTGLYLGVIVGVAAWLVVRRWSVARIPGARRAVVLLAIVALPTAVSWTTGALGWWDGTNVLRAALAWPLGLAAGAVVAAVAAKDLR